METGHHKNLTNFQALLSIGITIGQAYKPSSPAFTIEAMGQKVMDSEAVLQQVQLGKVVLNNTTNAREILFEPLKKLSTRIMATLQVSGATTQTIDDARTSHNKLRGSVKKKAKKVDPSKPANATPGEPAPGQTPEDNTRSSSQQSFDSQVKNFGMLLETIRSERNYNPNEADLKIDALTQLYTRLKDANLSVINQTNKYKNIIIQRDTVLYHPQTGLVYIGQEIKNYYKGAFGTTSPQYKQVSRLVFKDLST